MIAKLRFIAVLLTALGIGCTTSQAVVQSGAIREGMTKQELRSELVMTSIAEDPFLADAFTQFFPDSQLEILGNPARTFFFVFSNVNYPTQVGSFSSFGNGTLSRWYPTYQQAVAYVDSYRNAEPTIANPVEDGNKPQSLSIQQTERRFLTEVSSGSGFVVSMAGHLVTNNHVVQGCEQTHLQIKGAMVVASILTIDEINDLALLKADFVPAAVFGIAEDSPQLLSEIYVAGYPYGNSLSSSIKVTKGIISSLVGLGNNSSVFQIDAAIQPGNSGGPIVNSKGAVVGVAVSSLDQLAILERFGSLPQNTNFGIKSSVILNLLASNNVDAQEPHASPIDSGSLGKLLTDATVYISCLDYE